MTCIDNDENWSKSKFLNCEKTRRDRKKQKAYLESALKSKSRIGKTKSCD